MPSKIVIFLENFVKRKMRPAEMWLHDPASTVIASISDGLTPKGRCLLGSYEIRVAQYIVYWSFVWFDPCYLPGLLVGCLAGSV